jgi:hypothetical protein
VARRAFLASVCGRGNARGNIRRATATKRGGGEDARRTGERKAIEHICRRFQQQMADRFTSVVEQSTGRKVRVFLSETNIEQDVSVETFVLDVDPTPTSGVGNA